MKPYAIYSKLRERWVGFHTWMVGKSLGSYGGKGRIESPALINLPDRVFVGRNAVLCAGIMLACIKNETDPGGSAGEIRIGNSVIIRENVQITSAAKVEIGDGTAIGRSSLISDHDHGYEDIDKNIIDNPITSTLPVVIEDGCLLGCCVRVAPGVRIGRHTMVGFGSVVTKDLPPYSVAIGSPARVVRRYNSETGQWEACRPERGN